MVVSLPTLKALIMRSVPTTKSNRSTTGHVNSDSKKHTETYGSRGKRRSVSHPEWYHSHVESGHAGDEKIELVDENSRNSSTNPVRTTGAIQVQDMRDHVRVITDVTFVRNVP
jgi:hypothetical protein